MDPITIPEDLTQPDVDRPGLRTALREHLTALEAADANDPAVIDEIERTVDAIEAIDDAEAEIEQRAERRAAALARVADAPEAPEAAADETDEVEPEAEVEAVTEDAPATDTQPEPEASADGESQEDDVQVTDADQPEAVAASGPRSATALAQKRPSAATPKKTSRDEFMVSTAFAHGMQPGTPLTSVADVAKAIANTRTSFRNVPPGPATYLSIATGTKQIDLGVGRDAQQNFDIFREIQTSSDAIVASGAFCTPQTPLYDFFTLAVRQSPVEDSLPVVQAPRGGIRFITPPDNRELAFDGVAITDEADIDPEDDATWKPCVRVDCPDVEEEFVTGVSQCVTFGNLNYKTFPEQVEAFLEDVGIAFASTKETYYLDAIHGASTAVTGVDTGYGAIRDHVYNLALAATAYRKRNGMRRGATLRIYEPDWLMDLIKVDMAMDASLGLNFMSIQDSQVEDLYRAWGLDVVWYNDAATGTGQKWSIPQIAGAINPFPGTAQSYIFAPGTFVKLDGGTFDAGLVRDSTLNRTNDVQLFMEEWIGMAKLGLESVRLIDDLCANGAAITEGVIAYACG